MSRQIPSNWWTEPGVRELDTGGTPDVVLYRARGKSATSNSGMGAALGCVHDVQGLNTATPVAATSLVLRVTRVRLCRMAVAASSPSITGSTDFALSACAAIRPQRSATA